MHEMNFKNTLLPTTFSINCRGKLRVLDKPVVMGVLNITDDSFYAGSRHSDLQETAEKALQMMEEGAMFLDIGGQSTRPGARHLEAGEEADRILPVIEKILQHQPDAILSADTFHAPVARQAVEQGVAIINDISAGDMDPAMIPTAAALKVPFIAMHMQGRPQTMQHHPVYENVVTEVLDYFIHKTAMLKEAGIHDIIIDPGFGFGKNLAHNYTLLKHFGDFRITGCPLLAGLSRKSMIYKLLGNRPEDALNGTTALHMLALQQGARILRAHDVRQACETIRLWDFYQQQG